MDDRELLELTRMAMEVDDLEAGAESSHGPRLRLVGDHRRESRADQLRRGLMFAGGLIAAAACLAVAVSVLSPHPVAPAMKRPSIAQGNTEAPGVVIATNSGATTPSEQCIVMAVFRGQDGSCDCMQWKRQEWAGGKRLADVGRKELLDAVFQAPCTNAADRVVVLAFSGPPDSLPKTTEDAEAIANRIAAAPPTWHEDISSYASAAMPDLPKGSTIVAKSLAMNR
jgi:hypothetical protein